VKYQRFVDVLLTEAVFVAVFDEAFGGVDQRSLAGSGAFLVEHDYAAGMLVPKKRFAGRR